MVSNNQIQALLLQNSDAALMYFQNPINTASLAAPDGVVNYFRNNSNNTQELVTCFSKNRTDPFKLINMGACKEDTDISAGSDGRKQVVTQVFIAKVSSTNNQPFADLARGTDITTAKTESSVRLRLTSVSVMTGFISSDELANCLNKSATNAVACLSEKQALYNSQVAEYRFLSDFEPPQ